ncbi:hypothetical protein [Desulfatiferula olefinivorans]
MGKLLFNEATSSYNTGFIKGLFHQLDFLDDLRDAEKNVEALEKSVSLANTQRYVDVVADGGRKFELKNYSHYTGDNIKNVIKGLDKELAQAMANMASDDMVEAALKKIHFVFRGSPQGAEQMIKQMKDAGLKKLPKRTHKKARALFEQQMDDALTAVTGNIKRTMPELGEMVVFQGKTVPY